MPIKSLTIVAALGLVGMVYIHAVHYLLSMHVYTDKPRSHHKDFWSAGARRVKTARAREGRNALGKSKGKSKGTTEGEGVARRLAHSI